MAGEAGFVKSPILIKWEGVLERRRVARGILRVDFCGAKARTVWDDGKSGGKKGEMMEDVRVADGHGDEGVPAP